MRAATVNAVLIERPRVHEWLDENSKRVFRAQLKRLQQLSQWLGLATTFRQVLDVVIHSVLQKSRVLWNINQPAQPHWARRCAQDVPNRVAVWIAARQRREVGLGQ